MGNLTQTMNLLRRKANKTFNQLILFNLNTLNKGYCIPKSKFSFYNMIW